MKQREYPEPSAWLLPQPPSSCFLLSIQGLSGRQLLCSAEENVQETLHIYELTSWICGFVEFFHVPSSTNKLSRERPCRLVTSLHTSTLAPRYGRWLICGDIQGQKKVKNEPLQSAGLNLISRALALLAKAAATGLPVDR